MVRPPPPPLETKTYRIGPQQFQLIEIVAASIGMKPSTFVREAALEVARRELRVGPDAADR
jgi:hypothetical protein